MTRQILLFTRRNLKLYYRDKINIFFSLMSVLILLVLNLAFIASMKIDGLNEPLADYIGEHDAFIVVVLSVVSGLIIINIFNIAITMLGRMPEDKEKDVLKDYYITSASRASLIAGYILASVVVTMTFNILIILTGFFVIMLVSGYIVSILTILSTILVALLITLVMSPFVMFFMTLINTREQVGIISGFIGVASGFLGGLYVPFSQGSTAASLCGLTPFPHAVYILSNVLFGNIYNDLFGHLSTGSDAVNEMSTMFVLDFEFFGITTNYLISSLIVLGYGLLFFLLTFYKMKNEKTK